MDIRSFLEQGYYNIDFFLGEWIFWVGDKINDKSIFLCLKQQGFGEKRKV
jgi:hypothetical protein